MGGWEGDRHIGDEPDPVESSPPLPQQLSADYAMRASSPLPAQQHSWTAAAAGYNSVVTRDKTATQ
jgi:hypothetical protein